VKIRPSLKGLNKASGRTPVLTDPKGGGFSFAIVRKGVRNPNSSPIPCCWSALLAVSHMVVQTVSVPTFTWSMSGSIAVQLNSLQAAEVAPLPPDFYPGEGQFFCSKHASLPGLLSNPSIGDYIVLPDEPMSP
jgi:hypothetical protein